MMTDEQRLQAITEQLLIVRDNLFRGMSKSMQNLQAKSINEVLELPNFTQSLTQPAVAEQHKQRSVRTSVDSEHLEPVAWIVHDRVASDRLTFVEVKESLQTEVTPLYKAPPPVGFAVMQKPWVGLTDDERRKAVNTVTYSQLAMTNAEWVYEVQKATEAKLKEKNNGS